MLPKPLHRFFVLQFHYLLPEWNALENVLIPYWIHSGRPGREVVE
ncbi:hypothetical protein QBE54_08270 [Thermatribacter velox]|uniref:Uncharacterized protein n=1 Tax=Thermatribacter velox TaxID=3039681 RepID=A0ABZ2YBG3_9BACT